MLITKEDFAKFMFTLSKTITRFAPDLSDRTLLDAWYQEFRNLTQDELKEIYKFAVATFDSFPSIRQLKSGLDSQSTEDKARETSERMWSALCSGGSKWKKDEDLQKIIGPIGLAVAKMQGGWQAICDLATYDNGPTLKAQWRELAAALERKAQRGEMDTLPDFTKPQIEAGPVQNALKLLSSKITSI